MSQPGSQPSYAEDRAAIEDLMARYLFAMDWNDFDTYAECFTENGVLDYAMGFAEGRETIRFAGRSYQMRHGPHHPTAMALGCVKTYLDRFAGSGAEEVQR